MILITLGVLGNLLGFTILVYSRNKLPRIISAKYLMLLTITNTLYLIIEFYIFTYSRMIHHFKMDYDQSFQFFDSNVIVCKTLSYLKCSFRLLSTILTACLSLERLLAICWPLKVRSLGFKRSTLFFPSIMFSMIVPVYFLFIIDLLPNEDSNRILYKRLNVSKVYNFYSMAPSLGKYSCTARSDFSPYFCVSISSTF